MMNQQLLKSWIHICGKMDINDLSRDRLHHEIYLSDARKVAPEKWKTVIRHPIALLDTK